MSVREKIEQQSYTFRAMGNADLPALVDLWNNWSGWGSVDENTLSLWLHNNPASPGKMLIAETEEGSLVGMITLQPSRVCIRGELLTAVRIMAPVVSEGARQSTLHHSGHLAFQMISAAIEYAREQSFKILYGLPAAAWLSITERFIFRKLSYDYQIQLFPCARLLASSLESGIESADIYIENSDCVTDEFDSFYEKSRSQCISLAFIERNADWVNFRKGNNRLMICRQRSDNSIVGYSIVNPDKLLLEDVFAINPSMLEDVVLVSARYCFSQMSYKEIKIMLNKQFSTMRSIDKWENVDFVFGWTVMDLTGSNLALNNLEWFAMPND